MKKFLKNLVIFGLLFFLFDKIFIYFIAISPEKEVDKRLEMLLNSKINKDIIVVGSSIGSRDIIASQLESATKYSSYNLSYPGSDIVFHEFIIKTLLKFNKKPKVILLTLDYRQSLTNNPYLSFRLDRLYPLVKYDYINEVLVSKGEKNKILSQLFALHRMNYSNFNTKKILFTPLDTIFACGSMPLRSQKENENWTFIKADDYNNGPIVKGKLESFKSIVKLCDDRNIQLVLVLPPISKVQNVTFIGHLKELAPKSTKFYVYDSTNSNYLNKKYYYDKYHLNRTGAEIFTGEVADYVKTLKLNN